MALIAGGPLPAGRRASPALFIPGERDKRTRGLFTRPLGPRRQSRLSPFFETAEDLLLLRHLYVKKVNPS